MKEVKIRNYQIISILFIWIVGTLLQFTYKWSNENFLVGIFSTVNESVWEHLKLVYFPTVITIIFGYFYIKKYSPNYLCSKVIGMLTAMTFIVTFFYTYTGIIGKNISLVDISSFFVSIIIGEYISYILMKSQYKCGNKNYLITLIILFVCFVIFTFVTPKLNIFKDPLTNKYGIIRQ